MAEDRPEEIRFSQVTSVMSGRETVRPQFARVKLNRSNDPVGARSGSSRTSVIVHAAAPRLTNLRAKDGAGPQFAISELQRLLSTATREPDE